MDSSSVEGHQQTRNEKEGLQFSIRRSQKNVNRQIMDGLPQSVCVGLGWGAAGTERIPDGMMGSLERLGAKAADRCLSLKGWLRRGRRGR